MSLGTLDAFGRFGRPELGAMGALVEYLELTQRGDGDITGWIAWFLGCLDRCLDAAGDSLRSVLRKAAVWQRLNESGAVNDRQRRRLAEEAAERLRGRGGVVGSLFEADGRGSVGMINDAMRPLRVE